uniref:Uncharacterized protein n=1 Tax=Triticum urartu TaxID=4572 RepID=A0A8R7UUP7_TRIUA
MYEYDECFHCQLMKCMSHVSVAAARIRRCRLQSLPPGHPVTSKKHGPLDPTRNIKTKWDIIEWTSDGHADNLTPDKDQENNKDAKRQPFGFKDINNMAYEDLDCCSFSSALKYFGS